jgi:hypothetical protein
MKQSTRVTQRSKAIQVPVLTEQEGEARIRLGGRHLHQLGRHHIMDDEWIASDPRLELRTRGVVGHHDTPEPRLEAADEQEDTLGEAALDPLVVSRHELAGSALGIRESEKYDEHLVSLHVLGAFPRGSSGSEDVHHANLVRKAELLERNRNLVAIRRTKREELDHGISFRRRR